MPDLDSRELTEISRAFLEGERTVWVRNYRVACILAAVFTIAGSSLDELIYPEHFLDFFKLRLLCAVLLVSIWRLVKTPLGMRFYRVLGLLLPALPTFFLSLMIYETTGADSPYYAGFNLVLLGAAIILRWTFVDTLIVFFEVLGLYFAACLLHPGSIGHRDIFFNNIFFISVTGVFVVIGSYFYNQLRFREFAFRFQLDANRRDLEASNRKLVELDQLKSRFFANISHELRTPLTLLLAPLETLIHRFNHAFDEDSRNLLVTMHANGMRLLKLINDLLDLVRLESGRMEVKPEPLEVSEFVKGLASAARQVADDKRIRLETHVDPALGTALADRDKLEKVLLNLLFNALKFTPAGGRVELRAQKASPRGSRTMPGGLPDSPEPPAAGKPEAQNSPREAEDSPEATQPPPPASPHAEELVLSVSDTGMGIAEKNLPFVFDRFWQADGSSKRKYQGVGIGLSLVKELVEIQNGQVSVASQEGKGTTFTVRLPYAKSAGAANRPAPGATETSADTEESHTVTSEEWLANLYRRAELFPALTPLQQAVRPVEFTSNGKLATILVADDEPDMLRFLKSQLSAHYQVLEAVDGQQAVEKASQFLPDLILLDMMMPEKDGLQACRELRAHMPTQSIPVILLTARADEETKLAALEVGASDFLAKPFSTTELHVRIKNLVESHDYQRKLSKQNQALETTIEHLKETETQLVQTEKLASLGRMSAGIIHEINNPLNFVTTGLYALRNKAKLIAAEQRGEYEEILRDVEDGVKRVRDIVTDLRTFTHPDVEHSDQVEVAEVVGAALRFLSGEWREKVRIEQQLAEHQMVWANRNKLVHVLVNLLQNSLDALRHKKFEGEEPTVRIEGRVVGDRSLVVIRDNGSGIEAQHLGKIFDPFFTTKDVGDGMGLGLSICYRIVQEYGGRVSVKTEPGKYCEFTLEFPVRRSSAGQPEPDHGELVRL